MAARNALEVYDPALARKQQQLATPQQYLNHAPRPVAPPPISEDTQRKLLKALEKQADRRSPGRRRGPHSQQVRSTWRRWSGSSEIHWGERHGRMA